MNTKQGSISRDAISSGRRRADSSPGIGDAAPDITLLTIDGEQAALSSFWRERPVIVVFLRQFGCIFCREQAARLRQGYPDFRSAGGEVVCISQGDPKTAKAFSILFDLPFPLLTCGDDLSPYRRYGLKRGSFLELFGPGSIVNGFRALIRGHKQGMPVNDGFQMPGVFIVDTSGTVRFARRHKHAGDNPANGELLQVLETLK
jgi:peroxiredoxin